MGILKLLVKMKLRTLYAYKRLSIFPDFCQNSIYQINLLHFHNKLNKLKKKHAVKFVTNIYR